MHIPAYYFDGKSSRRQQVTLTVDADVAQLTGDVEGSWPTADLRVSERTRHGARKVTFPDGAYLEALDNTAFNQLLAVSGHQESLVIRAQQSRRGVVAALLATVAILILGYLYGIPAVSRSIAFAMPEKVERSVGRQSLEFLDSHVFEASALPLEKRDAIIRRFKDIAPPDAPHYDIVFRKSKIGPNAFALPSGHIILTDEIVKLVDDDEAVMGILAHELGHVQERHLMRLLIQSSTMAAIGTVLFGDVSTVVANIPALLLDMRYSRDIEREADDYAIALFKKMGLDLASMSKVFEKLGEKADRPAPYLSSHPATSERIARIKEGR
jgi:Zn-dependent protease with chaperone function